MNRLKAMLRFNEYLGYCMELVYPGLESCRLCGRFAPGAEALNGLCRHCMERWEKTIRDGKPCPRCGYFAWNEPCRGPCGNLPGSISRVMAAAPYEGGYRQMVHRLKYNGEKGLTIPMSYLMARVLASDMAFRERQPSCLVPVPLHPVKETERGFNQSFLLACQMSKRLGIPVRQLLIRQQEGRPQAALNKNQRLQGIGRPFLMKDGGSRAGKGMIVLVDDVVTTGATLLSCAETLGNHGYHEIHAVTFAAGCNKNHAEDL
jgi:ComF family protein